MGNCYSCNKQSQLITDDPVSLISHAENSLNKEQSSEQSILNKYTKITMDGVFMESMDDISYFSSIDPYEEICFRIHLNNMLFVNTSKNKGQMSVSMCISEDYLLGKKLRSSKVRQSIYHPMGNSPFGGMRLHENINVSDSFDNSDMDKGPFELAQSQQEKLAKGMKSSYPIQSNNLKGASDKADPFLEKYIWSSKEYEIDRDSSVIMDCDFESRYEETFDDLWNTSIIFKVEISQQGGLQKQIRSFLLIDFLVCAVGPRHFDLELKEFESGKSLGRLQFDLSLEQLKQVEVELNEITCKLNGKEEKPLFAQFKCIQASEIPEVSQPTVTQMGKFKKAANSTHYKWKQSDSLFDTPSVKDLLSLESLKNATMQIIIKVDLDYTQQQTEKVIQKIQERQRLSRRSQDEEDLDTMLLDDFDKKTSSAKVSLDRDEFKSSKEFRRVSMLVLAKTKFKSTTVSSNTLAQIKQIQDGLKGQTQVEAPKKVPLENDEDFENMVLEAPQLTMQRSKSISQNASRRQSLIPDARNYYKNYRANNQEKRVSIEEEEDTQYDNDQIAECFIGFSKLLQTEYRQFEKKDSFLLQNNMSFHKKASQPLHFAKTLNSDFNFSSKFNVDSFGGGGHSVKARRQQERKSYEEKLWRMGKIIGSVKGSFNISNLPVMNQMSLGILTENGIVMNQIPILLMQNQESSLLKMMGICSNKNEAVTKLIDLTHKLQKIDTQKPKNTAAKFKINTEREKCLQELISLLHDEKKHQVGSIFKYFDESDLIHGQQALIDLAFHCLVYVENVKYEFKKDYYDIMQRVMNRGEFRLNHMTLRTSDQVEADQFEVVRNEKIKMAQFYSKLIYWMLDDALVKFCRKDVEPYLKQYIENCISLSFFKIPEFQSIFLECLKEAENFEASIKEWKGINWDLDQEEQQQFDTGLIKLFDWKQNFYDQIPTSKEIEDAKRYVGRIRMNLKWQAKIQKRTIAFFMIAKNWSEFIQKKVSTYSLYWQDIPGYRIMVKSILIELKERNIADYPDSLIDATLALLQNTQLLNVFVQIVFLKTNAYDADTLQSTLLLVQKWINHIEKQHLPFPSNFDFGFFFKGILISLEIDHSLTIPRTLYLLYKTLHFYPIDQRCQIVHDIISKYFYQLFYSWSYTVREVFLCFLFYQVEYALFHRTTNFLGQLGSGSFSREQQQPENQQFVSHSSSSNTQSLSQMIQSLSRDSKKLSIPLQHHSQSDPVTMKDQVKLTRKLSLMKVKEAIRSFEVILYANPNDPTNMFNRQLDLKSLPLVSGLDLTHHLSTTSAGYSSLQVESRGSSKQRKGSAQKYKRAEFAKNVGSHENLTIDKESHLMNHHVIKRSQNQDPKIIGKAQTLKIFIQCFNIYKQKLKEVEIIDRYLSQKTLNEKGKVRLTSEALLLNSLSSEALNNDVESQASTIDSNLEMSYLDAIEKVPKELRVYLPQGVSEFYKYAQEYEVWRQKIPFQPNGYDFQNSMPEFNMEKNMPVEDDENLEKPDEW